MSEQVPNKEAQRKKARRVARQERDAKVKEYRTKHPLLSQFVDALEWSALAAIVTIGADGGLTALGLKTLAVTLKSTTLAIAFFGGIIMGVPPPSQWGRLLRQSKKKKVN